MTYEDVFNALSEGYIVHDEQGYQFKTLTVFAKPGKIKISVRWAAGIDLASDYVVTFEEALDGIKKAATVDDKFKLVFKSK